MKRRQALQHLVVCSGALLDPGMVAAKLIPGPRQIMIEASIVEAERRFAQNLGNRLSYENANNNLKAETSLNASDLHGIPAATAAISLLNRQATRALHMELSALEASGRGNIVSNPRVLATEDTEAVIEQGVELPYQVQYTRSACKAMFRKVNLRLEVIPTVYEEELISLSVEINKDSVASKTEHGYVIDTKHVRTQAMVESGGTVILGGVFQEVEKNEAHKVPGLGDIPLLGYLFKEEAKVKDKTELLIFLTPTLVQASNPR